MEMTISFQTRASSLGFRESYIHTFGRVINIQLIGRPDLKGISLDQLSPQFDKLADDINYGNPARTPAIRAEIEAICSLWFNLP